MKGFFPQSSLMMTKKPLPMVAACGECKLYKTCNSPKMVPSGKGGKHILIVGEAPGADEDDQGVQFVGKTGRRLRKTLQECGISPNADCTFTNALICRPPNNRIDNNIKIDHCRPNLIATVEKVKPEVIILLGFAAVKSLIGHLWKAETGKVSKWVGWQIPSQRLNAWVCPTWHPSYLERQDSPVLDRMFRKHIDDAVNLVGRPWNKVPDYRSQVVTLYDPQVAVRAILRFARNKTPVAFDYETNMLKPDHSGARIVSCSLSDGRSTIAFPWGHQVAQAMKRFLTSEAPKIASNMKFEDRWSRRILGVAVNNWHHDTMLAAHVLDNRNEISSIKFQAFVRLGQDSYDDHIRPYLKSKHNGGYAKNRIDDIDKDELLIYNGLDSLLEWKVAKMQQKEWIPNAWKENE